LLTDTLFGFLVGQCLFAFGEHITAVLQFCMPSTHLTPAPAGPDDSEPSSLRPVDLTLFPARGRSSHWRSRAEARFSCCCRASRVRTYGRRVDFRPNPFHLIGLAGKIVKAWPFGRL
jgi:hypothetical protein